jgi:hypothetical protein
MNSKKAPSKYRVELALHFTKTTSPKKTPYPPSSSYSKVIDSNPRP